MMRSARDRGWGGAAALLLALVALAPAAIAASSVAMGDRSASGAGAPDAAPVDPAPCKAAAVPAARATYGDWPRTILSPVRVLPADYAPPDLVSASAAGLAAPWQVRALVIDDLRALVSAASADGVSLVLSSAYRSEADQRDEFDRAAAEVGPDEAAREVARPGHSEHQLGTALDFADTGTAYDWLAANAWQFGFVQSYDGDPVGCMVREPWHYRYLGRSLARQAHSSGLELNDFLASVFGP